MGEGVSTINSKGRQREAVSLNQSVQNRARGIRQRYEDMKKTAKQLKKSAYSLNDMVSTLAYQYEMPEDVVREMISELV